MWQTRKMTPHPYSAHRRKRSREASLDEATARGLDLSTEAQIVGAIEQLYGKNKVSVNQAFDGKDRGFWMLPNGGLLSINPPDVDRAQQVSPYPIHHTQSVQDIKHAANLSSSPIVVEDSRVVRVWVTSYQKLVIQAVHLTESQISKLRSLAKQASDIQLEVDHDYAYDWKNFLKLAREKNAIVTSEKAPA